MPDEHIAEALAAALRIAPGMRALLPQADIARATLADELRGAGAHVTAVTAYRTVMGQGGVDLVALLDKSVVDALTFTSSSTVNNCLERLQTEGGELTRLRAVPAACIGPRTAATARDAGFEIVLTPDAYTLPALVAALAGYFSQ